MTDNDHTDTCPCMDCMMRGKEMRIDVGRTYSQREADWKASNWYRDMVLREWWEGKKK